MRCQQRRQHSNADSKTAAKPENIVSTHLLTLLMTPVVLDFNKLWKKAAIPLGERRERENKR